MNPLFLRAEKMLFIPLTAVFCICNSLSAQVKTTRNIRPVSHTVINLHQRAIEDLLRPPVQEIRMAKRPNEGKLETSREPISPSSLIPENNPTVANRIIAASPSPVLNYEAASDGAQTGSGLWTIPPDTWGAVGLDKVFTQVNNNYRVHNKTTGAQLSIVSIETFWDPLGVDGDGVFDPRVCYDPYNNRWIVAAVSHGGDAASRVLLGLSQTHDPQGNYDLYAFDPDPDASAPHFWADYPMLGFNKNWIAIGINMFPVVGGSTPNLFYVIDYPALLDGTVISTVFSGTGLCTHPAETYSSTESVLYAPNHLSSAGATYQLNSITGTPASPVFTGGAVMTRTGGGWAILGAANVGPQACIIAPCPGTPVKLELPDAHIRNNVVFRNNAIWYTQSVGLPSGTYSRGSAQWTKLNTNGSFADGGRIDDPTATATIGRWYSYPSIAVNSTNDALVGMSKMEGTGYAGAAYAMRLTSDAAGTMQDPVVYKDGEDYYHKDFGGGRNRWGDYSHTMVDPLDDASFWTIQEYAKLRVNPIVGGSNSKWGTWWAKVTPNACLSAVASGNWDVAGTWGCAGVPAAVSHVNIMSGHNVTLNVDPAAASITVNQGGTLTINSNRVLGSKLIVYGTLNITGGKLTLGSNNVFLSETATVTGASSTSYFVTNGTGTVSKIIPGGGSFEFPVSSNGSSFNSLAITLNAGDPAEVFSVRVSTGITPSAGNNSACVQRTWNINEMTTGDNNATLTFKWSSAEHGGSFSPAAPPYAFRHNGATYVFAKNMTLPVLASGIYSSNTTTTVNTFSPWILSALSTLPVKIDYFTGTKQNNEHLLNWKSTCTGAASFDLQRSADGNNFSTLYSITGDYLRCLQPFSHTDINPLAGKNFYRLKIRDESGKILYSHTILLLNSASGFEIVGLQPNVVSGNIAILNVSVANKQQLSIFVTDSKGSRLMEKLADVSAGPNLVEMNFTGMPSGTYFLTVVSALNEKKTLRFIKQ